MENMYSEELPLTQATLLNWGLKAGKASRGIRYGDHDDLATGRNLCKELERIDSDDGILPRIPGIAEEEYENLEEDVKMEEIEYGSEVIEELIETGAVSEEKIAESYRIFERAKRVFNGAYNILSEKTSHFYGRGLTPKRRI